MEDGQMPFPAMMSCFNCKHMQQHLILHEHWSKTRSLLLPKLRTGQGDMASTSGPHLTMLQPSKWNPILLVRLASLSSMQTLSASTVSNIFGPRTSFLAIPTYHVGQDLSSDLGTLTPEASQCSSGQGNDQPIWRPHFPFCLRTLLRQSLFKIIFFHRKHLANFFSPLKTWLQKGHTCIPHKCFLPCDFAEPTAHFPF